MMVLELSLSLQMVQPRLDLVIGADGMCSKVKDSLFKGQLPAVYE